MLRQTAARRTLRAEEEKQRDLEREYSRADLEKQIPRRFKVGDVYAPHDLTGVEMAKWKKLRRKGKQRLDVVDQLGIDPREHYKVCCPELKGGRKVWC
jgi:small subunit ribosomal protein S18